MLNTNIVVIIASHFFLNNEIFLQSCLPFDLFKLVDVTAESATMGRYLLSCLHIVPYKYISVFQCIWKSLQNLSIEKWGNLCSKNKKNIKRRSKGAHMRVLCRGSAKTPYPHRGLYSNRHLASCNHL